MNISSEIPLPDLQKSDSPADAVVRFGKITVDLINAEFAGTKVFTNPGVKVRATRQAMYFEWDRLGKILVRRGREIIVEPDAETLEEDLQPFLTGAVLAVLLHQRGSFVLHASAVEIGGAAVAFLGAKGFGKSTLAGFLKAKGFGLISDDIVPVVFEDGKAMTTPGFPRIKLYDDVIEAIGKKPSDFKTVHRFVEKRSFQFDEPFRTEPARLHAVYILSDGEAVKIEKIEPVEAFIEIFKNTHLNRFLEPLECRREYFEHCRKFIQTVPVFRLSRRADFGAMDEIAEKLEKNAAQISRTEISAADGFSRPTKIAIATVK